MRKFPFDERYFATIDTPAKAYWLGLLAADGCVYAGYVITYNAEEKDIGHMEKFRAAIGYGGKIVGPYNSFDKRTGRTSHMVAVSVSSTLMAADLAAHGVVARKSLVLRPWLSPNHVLQASWFAGLFDGDGSVGIAYRQGVAPHPRVEMTGTRAVVEAFADFVRANVPSSRYPAEKRIQQHDNVFQVGFKGRGVCSRILTLLYGRSGVWLDRKKALADEILALPVGKADWSHLTQELLLERLARLGTWRMVASDLGIPMPSLNHVRRRFGMLRPLIPRARSGSVG